MVEDLDDERPLDAPTLVAALCDRRFGVGADGVDPRDARRRADARTSSWTTATRTAPRRDVRQRRPVPRARSSMTAGLDDGDELDVATRAGIKHVSAATSTTARSQVTVGMGAAGVRARRDPDARSGVGDVPDASRSRSAAGSRSRRRAVSMGNPHLVLFVEDDPTRFHVAHIGPALERHELFPERTNVEFVAVQDGGDRGPRLGAGLGRDDGVRHRRLRGAVAANEAGLVPARTVVRFPGGDARGRAARGRRGRC